MKKHLKLAFTIMIILLIVLVIVSVTLGRYPIAISELFGILCSKVLSGIEFVIQKIVGIFGADPSSINISIHQFWTQTQEALFLNHRLPRIIMACLVGCSLSTAGASYQGVFQNPMAAPDLLGASSGAALGACIALILNLSNTYVMLFAFIFGLITVMIVIIIGERVHGKKAISLILAGIMISSLASSGVSFIKLIADPTDQLPAITYWLMGSLNGILPKDIACAVIPMAIGLIPLFLLRWRINILTLGDEEAQTIGINTRALRITVIICATLITAASVAVSGLIGWIGLVIPHMARKIVGNNYKYLLPASMLIGAIFLLIVDDISRNLFATEIPIGILTSLVGAPFFIYLIVKDGKTE